MKADKVESDNISRGRWLGACLVLLVGVIAYGDSLWGPFIFDDIAAIRENPQVRGFDVPPNQPVNSLIGRPLLRLTLMVDYAIAGNDVLVYHIHNVAIHLLAALTLYALIARNLRRKEFWGDRFTKLATALAAICAAVWVCHPLTTEAVTYVVERDESMASLFYLVTIYCFVRAAEKSPTRNLWVFGCLGACVAGMFSKEVCVTIPVVVFLYDRTFLAGSFKGAIQRRGWIHGSLLAICVGVLMVLLHIEQGSQSAGLGLGVTPVQYGMTQLDVVARYLRLIFIPTGQVLDYDWPVVTRWSQVGVGGWLVVVLGLATIFALWLKPWAGFLGAWFFIILGPSSTFYPLVLEIAAERRPYLAMAGPLVLVIVGGWSLFRCLNPRVRLVTGWVLAGAVILALTTLTLLRNADYWTAERIWTDTVKKQPTNARAEVNLGRAYLEDGNRAQAAAHFQKALELRPDYYGAASILGRVLVEIDRATPGSDLAEPFFHKEIAINPAFAAEGHFMLGTLAAQHADWQTAKAEFWASIAADPNNRAAEQSLFLVRRKLGEVQGLPGSSGGNR